MTSEKLQSVVIWGDSIMKGVVYDDARERYTLLEQNSARTASSYFGLELNNRARMGCTAEKGLLLLQKDLQVNTTADLAMVEFGGNDSDFDWTQVAQAPLDTHEPRTPLTRFREAVVSMVQTVREKGMAPFLMTLPPIDAQRYFDFISRGKNANNILQWLDGDVGNIYRWHERYNAAVVQMAMQLGCVLVDARDAFLADRHYEDLLCTDGIHPNARGHRRLSQALEAVGLQHEMSAVG